LLATQGEAARIAVRAAPPHVLRCLIVSFSAERRRLIRVAAETQTWDAIVCRDAGEFLRAVFKRSVPLMVVDLPSEPTSEYWELRRATGQAKEASSALLLVSGAGAEPGEEVWARSLGAWAYLNDASSQRGLEFVLGDARHAISRTEVLAALNPAGDAAGRR
jgi:hypothetical protein